MDGEASYWTVPHSSRTKIVARSEAAITCVGTDCNASRPTTYYSSFREDIRYRATHNAVK